MPPPSGDPRLEEFLAKTLASQIPALSEVYDRWANSLDPNTPGLDEAEKAFHQTLAQMYDLLRQSSPESTKSLSIRDFRRHVIAKCKLHLFANRKHPSP